MADIVINGATYKDVPSIQVPDENGEMVEFEERMTPYEACIAEFKANGWTEYEVVDTLTLSDIRNAETNKQYITKLPEMTKVPDFSECHNLVLKELTTTTTSMSANSFQYDDNIYAETFFPNVKEINASTFYGCCNLRFNELNKVLTYIGSYAFFECRNITISELPKNVSTLGGQAFQRCYSIVRMKTYDKLKFLGNRTYYSCRNLQKYDGYVTSIDAECFAYCIRMSAFILRSDLATLVNSSAFKSTPIASGAGYIYVPKSLVDSYKSATNWSVYANQFRALEDYTVDGTTTGELDESKI